MSSRPNRDRALELGTTGFSEEARSVVAQMCPRNTHDMPVEWWLARLKAVEAELAEERAMGPEERARRDAADTEAVRLALKGGAR